MGNKSLRLYFIDAMRAWAILMMLQGHFIDGLLDPIYRDDTHKLYALWKYFRGITAPVFFTVSGFIFTYLLIKDDATGFKNPRVKKGIKRGLQLLVIGYLLRLNFFGLLQGQLYNSFYLVDVLHCIGLSLLGIIAFYLLTVNRGKYLFPLLLLGTTLALFILEPHYKQYSHYYLPNLLANYLTQANGSVFTILPWFGYASMGAFLSVGFDRFKGHPLLYPVAIPSFLVTGAVLVYFSSGFFLRVSEITGVFLFTKIYLNNYLFIRLGNVLIIFAVFMLLRRFLTHPTLLKMGQSTLSIYVVHYILLYGSFTGLGLYGYLYHSLSPVPVIVGALAFMIVTTLLALRYENRKVQIKLYWATGMGRIQERAALWIGKENQRYLKSLLSRSKLTLIRLFKAIS